MSIVDLEDFRAFVAQAGSPLPANEGVLVRALAAAERQVGRWCGGSGGVRIFDEASTTATSRSYAPDGSCVLRIHDCVEVTAITVAGATLDLANVQVEPVNHDEDVVPIEQLRCWSGWGWARAGEATVVVTARWGWPETPADVEEAMLLAGKDQLASRKFDFGVLATGDGGVAQARFSRPIRDLLGPYRRLEAFGIG